MEKLWPSGEGVSATVRPTHAPDADGSDSPPAGPDQVPVGLAPVLNDLVRHVNERQFARRLGCRQCSGKAAPLGR